MSAGNFSSKKNRHFCGGGSLQPILDMFKLEGNELEFGRDNWETKRKKYLLTMTVIIQCGSYISERHSFCMRLCFHIITSLLPCQFMTLVNRATTAPLICLPSKGAKFCHTLNMLLVGRRCCHALLQLYFNSSATGCQLIVTGQQTTIRVAGL